MAISPENNIKATKLFHALNFVNGGRLKELKRYMRGSDVALHVCYWSRDEKGRLIIGENWHVSTPAAREPEHPGPFAEVDEDDPDRWEAEYNAKLNAAAPQMKEVCNLVVRRGMEQPSTAGAVLTLTHQDWLLARSVVATAEGRAE